MKSIIFQLIVYKSWIINTFLTVEQRMRRLPKPMIRYEILLPLFYNDGRRIEEEKFTETDQELVARFDATSTDTIIVKGHWIYQSTLYEDKLVRVRIDTEDTPSNLEFIRNYKEILKERFQQLDIWITAQQIEVI